MITCARGLDAAALAAIADLERRVVAADGGRLKLEWGALRSRSGRDVEDLLWWDGDRLLGFLGIYAFGAPTAELAGMVDVATRRRGIGTALLDAALPLCRERGYTKVLLVTPRTPAAGRLLAQRRGAVPDHSEYALELPAAPPDAPADPRITLRPCAPADTATVHALLAEGFGWQPSDQDGADTDPADTDPADTDPVDTVIVDTVIVEFDGTVVGSARVSREDDAVGVYGLVIRSDHRGHGVGRDVLRRICRRAFADGATRVHLEVAVDNDRALGLYTSLGCVPVATEDYVRSEGA